MTEESPPSTAPNSRPCSSQALSVLAAAAALLVRNTWIGMSANVHRSTAGTLTPPHNMPGDHFKTSRLQGLVWTGCCDHEIVFAT